MTEQTFKVGDKVRHETYGRGIVTYGPTDGPFGRDRVVIRFDGRAREMTVDPRSLTASATFEVGEKVQGRYSAVPLTIEAGPFTYSGTEWYAVRLADGDVSNMTAGYLSPAPADVPIKVGDRVRVLDDDPAFRPGDYIGKVGTVNRLNSPTSRLPYSVRFDDGQGLATRTWNVKSVERVSAGDTETIDGIAYDVTAKYKDRDGDTWSFKRIDGTVRGEYSSAGDDRSDYVTQYSDTLSYAVREFGPLRRV